MTDSILTVHLTEKGVTPTSLAAELLRSGQSRREVMRRIADRISSVVSGVRLGKATVRVDGSAAVAAVGQCVADQSDATAGDTLTVNVPGYPASVITVVATGGVAANGEVSADASNDSDFGDEIAAVFNSYPPLARHFIASNNAGTVTITARQAGSWGNGITFVEAADSDSPFAPTSPSGGMDAGAAPTATITCGAPDVEENDTITIGSVTLVWKDSPGGEDEVATSATPATAATNLAAKINAHSQLRGLITAERSDTVITLTWLGDPRAGELVALARAESNSGSIVLSGSALASGSTESYGADPRSFTWGAA